MTCTDPIETFYGGNGLSASTIDHIMIRNHNLHFVEQCCVAENYGDNLSYHLPVFCTICIPMELKKTTRKPKLCLSWKTIQNRKILCRYQKRVKENVENLTSTMATLNSFESVEQTTSKITELLIQAAFKTILQTKFKPNLKPYWKNGLDNLHEVSRRHRRLWIEAGRPRQPDNQYFKNYKEVKRAFRRELRRKAYVHETKNLENDAYLYDFDRCTLQKLMSKRNLKGTAGNELNIGDRLVKEDKELLDVWKSHYEDLYTLKDNRTFDAEFKHFVEAKVQEFEPKNEQDPNDPLGKPFSLDQVQTICDKLPNGKSGGTDGLVYEHLKYAGVSLYDLLTRLFNAIRELEDVPESYAIGKIISLFKGKNKDRLQKCNYRGITLLNVIGKVFECLILDLWMPLFGDLCISHPLQFAYQKGKGCTQASFVLREAIYHYLERGSKVYACFLDSPKAFDTVWMDGLFYKLYNPGIKGKTWRLLRKWYGKLSSCVWVNDLTSDKFPISQGVHQGGVLSPWLYMYFNNDIPFQISQKGHGITVDALWCGNVLGADDITLLCSQVSGLQSMLRSVEEYSKRWRFEFNPSKTVEVTFGKSVRTYNSFKNNRQWQLNDCAIKMRQSCKHVGMILAGDDSQKEQGKVAAKKGKEVVALDQVG